MATPIATIRDARLSRWQSTVESVLRQMYPDLHISEIRRMPQMQGVYQHIKAAAKSKKVPMPDKEAPESVNFNAYTSQQFSNVIPKLESGIAFTHEMILDSVDDWPYSTDNVHRWVWEAIMQYSLEWFTTETFQYRDPVDSHGNYDPNKSVIDWKMPSTGKIILLGDWGTSCADATELLRQLLAQCGTTPPACIIHLGDIYYAGTQTEVDNNFYNVIRNTLGYTGPVFTIPGNHEYYDFGDGYFYLIDKLNSHVPGSVSAVQSASYFCLRTDDNRWQFLGLDTGYNDSGNYTTYMEPPAPDLKSHLDVSWAQDKLQQFGGKTIMLTHHQLFSRSAEYMNSDPFGEDCANPYLYSYFGNFMGNHIAAWFWGHEHSFALFENGLMGLNMGRLVGSSSYEEAISDDPYAINYPLIPYNSNNVQVSPNNYSPSSHDSDQYYPHVGAILQMNGANNPTITYYSFPSWDMEYAAPSSGLRLTALVTETITNPVMRPTGLWNRNGSKSYNSDYGPCAALIGDSLYLAYQNRDDSGKIYWDNASVEGSKLTKNTPAAIGSSIKTDQNPAMVNFNGQLLMVYKLKGATDLYWCVYDPGTETWSSNGKLEDSILTSPNIQSNYGPSMTVFNGKVYLLYLHDGDDQTVRWLNYDGTTWNYHGSKTVNGSTLKSYHKVCPAIASNDSSLFITVCNNSKNLTFITGDTGDNWNSMGIIANGHAVGTNIPTTSKSLAMCANNQFVELFYVDDDNYIRWAIYNLAGTSNWTGGIRTMVSPTNLPQTGHVPCILEGAYYSLLLYRGNSNHNLYYSTRIVYG